MKNLFRLLSGKSFVGCLIIAVTIILTFASQITAQNIGAGGYHTIVVKADGTVYTWGNNEIGQLGNGNNTDSNVPVAVVTTGVLSGKTIIDVAAGVYHSIALTSDGTVYTWGRNNHGQLGNGTNTDSNVPVAVGGILSGKTIIDVAAGGFHSIAMTSDGTVYTWGDNEAGQLGNGTNGYSTDSNVPVAVVTSGVLSGKTVIDVAAGGFHSIALASDRTVYTWGYNGYGQLGNGTNTDSNVPVAVVTSGVLSGKTIIDVAAGYEHSIALASDGTVYTWGHNDYDQLGNGTNANSNVPVAVVTSGVLFGKTIIAVAAGYFYSIALASDRSVYSWGGNGRGQLGNGTNIESNVPVAAVTSGVLSGKTIVYAVAGFEHSIALASDGTVFTWGYNYCGQLGNGTNTNSNVPVAVDQSSMGPLLSPEQVVENIINEIGGLIDSGDLTDEDPVPLSNVLDQILEKIENKKINSAIKQLNAFINQVNAYINSGRLTNEVGQTLITSANDAINNLLQQANTNEAINNLPQLSIKSHQLISKNTSVPEAYKMEQNYPNPFNPTTNIRFQIIKPGLVTLKIYDILGREVTTIINKELEAGYYNYQWDGSRLANGIYFYRITAGDYIEVKKMILMK